jgi:uncharacterized protein
MRINEIIWLDAVVDKLAWKHGVDIDEVEEAFANGPQFRLVEKGDRAGEDVYMASGLADVGRYLTILFIYKESGNALILSARDMADWETRRYERK